MTASIRFTPATVREVAARVKVFTDGYFALDEIGDDEGRGVRYDDAHRGMTWYGPEGARQACAYYMGAAFETKRLAYSRGDDEDKPYPYGGDDEAFLLRVQAAYMEGPQRRKNNMMHWEEQGAERARLRADSGA